MTPGEAVSESAIPWRRLANLRLVGSPLGTPEAVVRWLGAVQSQDYGPAKWSVGQRVEAVHDAAFDHALAEGAILRTHILRPTWHFVLPEDIRWMLELTAPRVLAFNAYYYRQRGLDRATFDTCNALLLAELAGGRQRTRREIGAIFARAGIAADGETLGSILMNAELSGLICSGALQGKQHTYALLEERAPRGVRLTRDEALAELTLRYFRSHGPATIKDFRWWSSLTLAEIARGLAMVADHLQREEIDGVAYWSAPSAPPQIVSPTVHLLQAYDEYVVGYSESKRLIDCAGAERSQPVGRSIANAPVILNTQVAGHWKRTQKKRSVEIEATLYTPFNDAQARALEDAAARHGAFLDLPATLVSSVL